MREIPSWMLYVAILLLGLAILWSGRCSGRRDALAEVQESEWLTREECADLGLNAHHGLTKDDALKMCSWNLRAATKQLDKKSDGLTGYTGALGWMPQPILPDLGDGTPEKYMVTIDDPECRGKYSEFAVELNGRSCLEPPARRSGGLSREEVRRSRVSEEAKGPPHSCS